MIMGHESLPYLLQPLVAKLDIQRSIVTPTRTLMELYVGYPTCFTRSRLQTELLQPFAAVRELRPIFVKGNVDRHWAMSFMVKVRYPYQSETKLLKFSDAYWEKGDTATAGGLTRAANFFHEQGKDFTLFAGQSYLKPFQPQAGNEYMAPRISSMLNTGQPSALKKWNSGCEEPATVAVRLQRGRVADIEAVARRSGIDIVRRNARYRRRTSCPIRSAALYLSPLTLWQPSLRRARVWKRDQMGGGKGEGVDVTWVLLRVAMVTRARREVGVVRVKRYLG